MTKGFVAATIVVLMSSSAWGQSDIDRISKLINENQSLRQKLAQCQLDNSTADLRLKEAKQILAQVGDGQNVLKRAQIAEAEVARLREQVARLTDERNQLTSRLEGFQSLLDWLPGFAKRFEAAEGRAFTSKVRSRLKEDERGAIEPLLDQIESGLLTERVEGVNQAGKWTVFENTTIDGRVNRIRRGTLFKTQSRQVYEVSGFVRLIEMELNPEVTVLTDGVDYKLVIHGVDEPIVCKRIAGGASVEASGTAFEAHIDGEFNGFEYGRLYKLQNGQVWEQTNFSLTLNLGLSPKVTFWKVESVWNMKVDGVDDPVTVRQIR